ncbi:MAG: HEAT repeat domain-containing protein [Deltaproteobacteria bacterium]|nr:MAG: HEAT repeat domain-containing protein [Deltaproteobacteria bacterium]
MTMSKLNVRWYLALLWIGVFVLGSWSTAEAFVSKENTAKFVEHLNAYPKAKVPQKVQLLRKMLRLYSWKRAVPNSKQMEQWLDHLRKASSSSAMELQERAFYSFGEILEKLSFFRHKVKRKQLQSMLLKSFPWKSLQALCKRYSSRSGRGACFNLTWLKHHNDSQGLKALEEMLQASAGVQQHALFFIGTQKIMPAPKHQAGLAQLIVRYAERLTTERLITAMMVLHNLNAKQNWYKLTFYQYCLGSTYARTRRVAADFVRRLGAYGKPAALLLSVRLKDKDNTVRRDAIRALGALQLPKPLLQIWLTPMLKDPYGSARSRALLAFQKNKVPPLLSAVPELLKMAHGKDSYERFYATGLLPLYGKEAVSFLPQLLKSMKDNPNTRDTWAVLRVLQKAGKSKALLPSLKWLLLEGRGSTLLVKTLSLVKTLGKKATSLFPEVNKLLSSRSARVGYAAAMALQEMEKGNAQTMKQLKVLFQKNPSFRQDLAETMFKVSPRSMFPETAMFLLGSDYYAALKGMDKLSFQIMVIGPMLTMFKIRVEFRQLYQALNPLMFPKLKKDIAKSNRAFAASCKAACRKKLVAIGKSVALLYESKMAQVIHTIHTSKAHPEVQKQAIDLAITLLDHFALMRKYHRNDLKIAPPKGLCLRLAQASMSKRKSMRKPCREAFLQECVKGKDKALLDATLKRTLNPTTKPTSAPSTRMSVPRR